MSGIVEVYLWGIKVGVLGYEPNQKEFASFEYDKDFINKGVEISPLKVPTRTTPYLFDSISLRTFHGLPGFIADSLPDKFGSQLIDQFFASKGKIVDDITALDRLLYIGNRSMGALEFRKAIELEKINSFEQLNLQDLSELAELVIKNKEQFSNKLEKADRHAAIELLKIGSSAGGARAKCLVAVDKDGRLYDGTVNQKRKCNYYLLKFDTGENSDRDNKDPKEMTRVEYIYSLIAKECKINMPNTTYIEDKDDFHFLIERFDRIDKDKSVAKDKLHYVSWCGMAHAHRDSVGTYSYEQLVLTIRELKLGNDAVEEIFKRAVFNIVGRNQDDHTKNFGFLMDKQGLWNLSPAFDMTYSYDPSGKWTKNHQINLNGKNTDFTKQDIIKFGEYCNIKEKKALEILEHTQKEFQKFEDLANRFNVPKKLKDTVIQNLRIDLP